VQNDSYQYFTDITHAPGDKITVTVIPPRLNASSATFLIPAYTTGSYKVMNFGRFVSELKAFDENGSELQTFRSDTNAWDISGANVLYKITYRVDDTFDDKLYPPPVFEPSGTNFEEGKNFVFNNYGIFGYIEGLTKAPVTLTVNRPVYFYATTAMDVSRGESLDVFSADNFFEFTDNPIMFCKPDTATIMLDNSSIMFSVYSEKKNSSAIKIAGQIKDVLKAHKNSLGG
jgi:predicted metalloprotease with PDZ domain